tara:strand:+ start:16233 stop:16415 length:183 start_codon:yes stop_codon:yes gene_type:complete
MDLNNDHVIEAAKEVILSYCEYLLELRDKHSLAENMRELLYSLPESVIEEIQLAEFKKGP